MKLIIGLGNPGWRYRRTRHNFGWLVLDKLAGKKSWQLNKKIQAEYLETEIGNQTVQLIKPLTYMNNSGLAVAAIAKNRKLEPKDIIVIHDDLDLNFGQLRIGCFESAGGHNGIKSIIAHLGFNNFIRFRLGIKNELTEKIPAEKFVISRFAPAEKEKLESISQNCIAALTDLLETNLDKVMNKYN
jgi:PTH1 family peptidyl-tRNA hydrolase